MPLIIKNNRGQYYRGVSLDDKTLLLLFKRNELVVSDVDFKNIRESLFNVSDDCLYYSMGRPHSIFMGGDHSTSFGTVMSSLRKYGNNFKLVWIDAHTDIHSFESSPSWNLHGMVVRMLMEHQYHGIPQLMPEQIIFIGTRSSEKPELDFIRQNNIQVIKMTDLQRDTIGSINRLKNFIKGHNVHISLDVDVLDPTIMSSTGTREPGGLMIDGLIQILHIIDNNSNHYATDIMEFNPDLGNSDTSLQTIKKVIHFLN
jgi:arginase